MKLHEICLFIRSYMRSNCKDSNKYYGFYLEPVFNLDYSVRLLQFAGLDVGEIWLTVSVVQPLWFFTLGSSNVWLSNAFLISSTLRHWRGRRSLVKKLVIVALADGFTKTSWNCKECSLIKWVYFYVFLIKKKYEQHYCSSIIIVLKLSPSNLIKPIPIANMNSWNVFLRISCFFDFKIFSYRH